MSAPGRTVAPAPGRLLVATPVIEEPIFFRTVIGLLEHDDEVGTLGVVLNRPGELLVAEAIPSWADAAGSPPVLFRGGPVAQGSALALAELPRPGERRADRTGSADPATPTSPAGGGGGGGGGGPGGGRSDGDRTGSPSTPAPDMEGLTPLFDGLAVLDLDRDPVLLLPSLGRVRFYHGYAGWGPQQLLGELHAGAWWVLPSVPADWFSELPLELWGQVLARQGGSWIMWAHAPDDPTVN